MKIAVFAAVALVGVATAIGQTAAPWTLWLISWSPSVGRSAESNASAVVTPLAIYERSEQCYAAIDIVTRQIKKAYDPPEPSPGMMICVPGLPAKR